MTERTWTGLFLVFAVAIVAVLILRVVSRPESPLPDFGSLPDFSLVNQRGDPFTRAALAENVTLADFIFTTCAGPCPVMTAEFVKLQGEFADRPDLRLLSISVNPEYDTPEILTAYGKGFGADFGKWSFLTGAREAIHRLAVEGFHIGSIEDPVFHSTRFVLIDRQGRIRGYYTSTEPEEVENLSRDARRLLSEAAPAS